MLLNQYINSRYALIVQSQSSTYCHDSDVNLTKKDLLEMLMTYAENSGALKVDDNGDEIYNYESIRQALREVSSNYYVTIIESYVDKEILHMKEYVLLDKAIINELVVYCNDTTNISHQ